MTPIERAAEALAEYYRPSASALDVKTNTGAARAVLQALREPSVGMVQAGTGVEACEPRFDYHGESFQPATDEDAAKEVWQAMIDAALSE